MEVIEKKKENILTKDQEVIQRPIVSADVLTKLNEEALEQFNLEDQPTYNIGCIGHVAHGKSSCVKHLTGVSTAKHNAELARNMTIKLGYANLKIYKCDNPKCPRPECYSFAPPSTRGKIKCLRNGCNSEMSLVRHISFVDCPGHEILMQTMLSGAAVMDSAMMVIAANQQCPAPQTKEHLAAVDIMGLDKNMIVLQNKIDLVSDDRAMESYREIKQFIGDTTGKVPIIPVSAIGGYNFDVVVEMIAKLPKPNRPLNVPPFMTIIRSFDVNKPGSDLSTLTGGVVGGSLLRGQLKIDQKVEIRPGLIWKDSKTGETKVQPLLTKVIGLRSDTTPLKVAVPGGLIAVNTLLDPSLTRSDRMVGQVLGIKGEMPPVYETIEVNYVLMKRLVGVTTKNQRDHKIKPLSKGEMLKLNIGSLSTRAIVVAAKADLAKLKLAIPACFDGSSRIAINRQGDNKSFRLIGFCKLLSSSKPLTIQEQTN